MGWATVWSGPKWGGGYSVGGCSMGWDKVCGVAVWGPSVEEPQCRGGHNVGWVAMWGATVLGATVEVVCSVCVGVSKGPTPFLGKLGFY